MDFFYDGQIRRYVTQFMRIFIGFKYQTGGDAPEQKNIPVMYGDMTHMVASIIKENSENKMSTVPRISCYITGLELDKTRLSDPTFISKVQVRERQYTKDNETGLVEYQNIQGNNYTVERLMPTPYTLRVKADIWTSNTDQKLQILEQILVLFNPSLEIQTTDNYIDWTSLSAIYLDQLSWSSRQIPQGVDTEIDITSIDFEMPIYITPPAKVKKLGIVQSVIANAFTESGDVVNLEELVFNNGNVFAYIAGKIRFRILLFKSQNGQPYDYDVTIVDPTQAVYSLGLDQKLIKTGAPVPWDSILDVLGKYTPGLSQIYFKQPSGYELFGRFTVNPVNPEALVVTFDQDTIPTNTLIASTINGVPARGTVDSIIDPYKYSPIEVYGSASSIPTALRFLMLDDVNNSISVGGNVDTNRNPLNGPYDGPDGWKDASGQDPVIKANSIIEWNGSTWVSVFDPATATVPTYIQNLKTGIKYRWTGTEWLKAFEGEYYPGFWGFNLNP